MSKISQLRKIDIDLNDNIGVTKPKIGFNILTVLLTLLLLLFSFFTLAIMLAGGHGNSGLHDHADSFVLYMVILYCIAGIVGINILNFFRNYKDSKTYRGLNFAFAFIVLTASFLTLIATIISDSNKDNNNIKSIDYFLNITIVILLAFMVHRLWKR